MKSYSRKKLAEEILGYQRSLVTGYRWLKHKPEEHTILCPVCHTHNTVKLERFGDGDKKQIYWTADVFIVACNICKKLYLWIELTDQELIDQENRKILIEACDRELKLLGKV